MKTSSGIKVTKADVDAVARCNELKPTWNDLKHLPGYWEKPAKVMRTGVGMVDGFERGISFKPNEGGKLTKTAAAIGEAMKPFARADNERIMNKTGIEPHRLMRCKGKRVMIADSAGKLWKRIGDEWVEA